MAQDYIVKTTLTGENIYRVKDGVYIPLDEGNADYQAYREWVDLGNVADVEDTPVVPPEPTKAQLIAQLQELSAKIAALPQ